MPACFFVSDLHGRVERYWKLLDAIVYERPAAVFLGGDLLPGAGGGLAGLGEAHRDFVEDFLVDRFSRLRAQLGRDYPRVFLILGNDDCRAQEAAILNAGRHGVWEYVHQRRAVFGDYDVYGYACVPPTPFLLKDWERYDVSRFVDPGAVAPEEGHRSVPLPEHEVRYGTIQDDLARLVGERSLARAILLCHSPPYQTRLDRAALDDRQVEHAPVDVHVGSMALRRLIEARQPKVTLHGHVHEAARLSGAWQEQIGATWCLTAAHDGPELALVRFDPDDPARATRTLA